MTGSKPWLLAPVLAALALGVSGYWWHTQRATWSPPPARTPDLPVFEPIPGARAAVIRHAQERPVLWVSRRPPQVDEKKKDEAADALSQSRLMAVVESGSQRVAMLQQPDGSKLKITTETKPWRIESFDGRKAQFVSADGRRIERLLEAGAPPPKPRGAAALPVRPRNRP